MQALSCPNCGAPVDAPASPDARVLRCSFCLRTFEVRASPPPSLPRARLTPALLIVGALVVVLGLGAVGLVALRSTAPPAPTAMPPAPTVAPTVVPADDPAIHPTAAAPVAAPAVPPPSDSPAPAANANLEPGPVTITWKGRLTSSSGSAPPAGAPCTLTATVASRGTGKAHEDLLTLQCQGQMLYDSSVPLNGMSNSSFGLDEVPTAGEAGVFRYQMRAEDVGPRSAPRAQITLSTPDHVVEAFRDGAPSFRVRATVDTFSAERRALPVTADSVPPFDEVVARKAKVTSKTGAPPFGAAACDLRISPGYSKGHNCRIVLSCGGRAVYGGGTGGFADCALVAGRPVSFVDAYPTPSDGDPELNCDLDAATATLGDTSKSGATYSVTFALSAP
jgi:hypothetical protein